MRLKSKRIVQSVAVIAVMFCSVAVLYRGELLLQWYIKGGSIAIMEDGAMESLPAIKVGPHDRLRVCSRKGCDEIGCQLDESSAGYVAVTNWLGSMHMEAIPSFCDFLGDYSVILEGPEPFSRTILITVIGNSLIVYDLHEKGDSRQYVRAVSCRDMKLLWALNYGVSWGGR